MNETDRTITLRPLTQDDVPFGMGLKDEAGWNQVATDWERFIALEPAGCFVARTQGREAGTITTTGYGDRFGWVGMLIVAPELRGLGVGRALLRRGIRYLEEERGVAAVRLDATPAGRPLYESLGFRAEGLLERRQGVGWSAGPDETLPDLADGLAEVCAYDAARFGADRSRVLGRLATEPGVQGALCRGTRIPVEGYIVIRPGAFRHYIGPWVAEHPEAARRLWHWAVSRIPGEPFCVDVPLANPAVEALVPRERFAVQRPLIRMCRGENRYPGQVGRIFGISGPEMG